MMKAGVGVRIVALSATPGNNPEKIQEVLTNLCIAKLEVKDEEDADVKPYVHSRDVKEIVIKQTMRISMISDLFNRLIAIPAKALNGLKLFPPKSKLYIQNPWDVNRLKVVQILEEFNQNQDEYTLQIGNGKYNSSFSAFNAYFLIENRVIISMNRSAH